MWVERESWLGPTAATVCRALNDNCEANNGCKFGSKFVFESCYFWVHFFSLLLLGTFFTNCTKFNQLKLHDL
jgi:hypothetical protein